MKVVYLKNQGSIKRGDIKEVTEGYTRNFLIPQGVAVLATKENIELVSKDKLKKTVQNKNNFNKAKALAEKLKTKKIEIKGKAGESGKLYASISEKDIKEKLKLFGFNVNDAKISSDKHLKEVGEYDVLVDFGHQIVAKIIVVVKI